MRFLALAVLVAAVNAGAQVVCDPVSACSCTAQSCTCTGTACDLQCLKGPCSLTGANGSRLACEFGAVCTAQAGSNSSLTCEDGADCQVTLGANSTALCKSQGQCVLQVGNASAVSCSGTASNCSVTCTGTCTVTSKPAGVMLLCPSAFPLTTCSSTVTSCGDCPPVDAGTPDAGPVDSGMAVPDSGPPLGDAGLTGPATLALGCGCSSTSVTSLLFALSVLFGSVRRSRNR